MADSNNIVVIECDNGELVVIDKTDGRQLMQGPKDRVISGSAEVMQMVGEGTLQKNTSW